MKEPKMSLSNKTKCKLTNIGPHSGSVTERVSKHTAEVNLLI